MADVSKMAEDWLSEHPDATKKEIWLAGATVQNNGLKLWKKKKIKSQK